MIAEACELCGTPTADHCETATVCYNRTECALRYHYRQAAIGDAAGEIVRSENRAVWRILHRLAKELER